MRGAATRSGSDRTAYNRDSYARVRYDREGCGCDVGFVGAHFAAVEGHQLASGAVQVCRVRRNTTQAEAVRSRSCAAPTGTPCAASSTERARDVDGDVAMGPRLERVASAPSNKTLSDAERLVARRKQLAIGKKTDEYQRYAAEVPREQRQSYHPQTPDPAKRMSKRRWDGKVKQWRRMLHRFDDKFDADTSGTNTSAASKAARTNTSDSNAVDDVVSQRVVPTDGDRRSSVGSFEVIDKDELDQEEPESTSDTEFVVVL